MAYPGSTRGRRTYEYEYPEEHTHGYQAASYGQPDRQGHESTESLEAPYEPYVTSDVEGGDATFDGSFGHPVGTYNPTASECSCGNWCAYPGGCWRPYGGDDLAEATYADHNSTEKPKCNCARKSGPHGWGSKCQDFDLKQKSKSKGRAKESSSVKFQGPSSTSMKKSSHGKGKHSHDQGCSCGLGCIEGSGCRGGDPPVYKDQCCRCGRGCEEGSACRDRKGSKHGRGRDMHSEFDQYATQEQHASNSVVDSSSAGYYAEQPRDREHRSSGKAKSSHHDSKHSGKRDKRSDRKDKQPDPKDRRSEQEANYENEYEDKRSGNKSKGRKGERANHDYQSYNSEYSRVDPGHVITDGSTQDLDNYGGADYDHSGYVDPIPPMSMSSYHSATPVADTSHSKGKGKGSRHDYSAHEDLQSYASENKISKRKGKNQDENYENQAYYGSRDYRGQRDGHEEYRASHHTDTVYDEHDPYITPTVDKGGFAIDANRY